MPSLTESQIWDEFQPYQEESAIDLFFNCAVWSVISIIPTVFKLMVLNAILGLLISSGLLSISLLHIISGFIGIYLICTLESPLGKSVLFGCFMCSYLIILLSRSVNRYLGVRCSNFVKVFAVPLLILCEYYLIGPEVWLEIRGIIMILVMKIISLADDVEQQDNLPNILEFFGYVLCSANVLFGPWISFSDYLSLFYKSGEKGVHWIRGVFCALIRSLIYLTLSNCWMSYFITEDSNRFSVAFVEAFSFRTSHYFICYLSEVGMVAAGFTNTHKLENKQRFVITEPLEIELPSSLAMVVKKWNQPMHDFLKKYVYCSMLSHGKFAAILVTFIMSSFLHGLEIKVSTILITIGVFSYLQVLARDKVARIFDCCVRVRPCKSCTHKHKRSDFIVKCILFIYSLGTIFHLLYLGILMDVTTDTVGIYKKWEHLYFLGHILMLMNVLLTL